MAEISNTAQFIVAFAEHARMSQKDVRYVWQQLGSFIDESIELQRPFKTNLIELYFSNMKSRKTKLFGELPPSRKVKVRLANKYRMAQKGQNKVMKTVLEKTEIENSQPLTDLE